MSVWSRLSRRSEHNPATSKPRLGLESLEAREVPAIVFVGGWGSSAYQYAHNDPSAAGDAVPTDQFSLNYAEIKFDALPPSPVVDLQLNPKRAGCGTNSGSDYSAVVFVGGWGASASQSGPSSLGIEVHCVRRADPLPVLMVLADQRDFYSTGGAGRDVLIADQTVDAQADPTTVADDVVIDGRIITGENYDAAASSGYIRVKKLNSGG